MSERPEFDRELLDLHEKTIRRMAKPASDRKGCKEVAAALRRMLVYDGGNERVKKMLADWKSAYANRPAMIQKLESFTSKSLS
jgi:hypothetical protein